MSEELNITFELFQLLQLQSIHSKTLKTVTVTMTSFVLVEETPKTSVNFFLKKYDHISALLAVAYLQ